MADNLPQRADTVRCPVCYGVGQSSACSWPPPAIRVTTIDGATWVNAADLIAWARSGGTEAGRELAEKVGRMAEHIDGEA